MLSHDEHDRLRAIEQWFEESDPAFARMLRDYPIPERAHHYSAGRLAVDLTGVLLLIIGVATMVVVLVLLGVLVTTVGICLHLSALDPDD